MKKILGYLSLILSIILILNSQRNLFGIYLSPGGISEYISLIAGLVFLIVGIALMFATVRREEDEEPFSIRYGIETYLQRDSIKSRENDKIRIGLDRLRAELEKGNFEAGVGKPGHVEGTSVFYLRHNNGARLFYIRTSKNEYRIIGESGKKNESRVINRIKEHYKN